MTFIFDTSFWKLAHRLLLPRETFTPTLVFCAFFRVGARTGQTDGTTDGRARPVMWPIWWQHNKYDMISNSNLRLWHKPVSYPSSAVQRLERSLAGRRRSEQRPDFADNSERRTRPAPRDWPTAPSHTSQHRRPATPSSLRKTARGRKLQFFDS